MAFSAKAFLWPSAQHCRRNCDVADDNNENSPGSEQRMSATKDWLQFALDLPIRSSSASKKASTSPSTDRTFHYSAANAMILGGVIERAAHTSVQEFAKKALFGPLGIEAAEWQITPSGMAMTGGGLRLQSRDLLKLGQLYANGGVWNGQRVVSKSWVEKSTEPKVQVNAQTSYGYLWWLRTMTSGEKKLPVHAMLGNGGNIVAIFPTDEMVVVVTSTNYKIPRVHEVTNRLLSEFILASVE